MSGYTPLHTLVSRRSFGERPKTNDDSTRDYVNTARILLKRGAKVEAKAEQGKTPLHFAASYGDLELVKLLVAAGASIHTRTASGATPLHLVASGQSLWGNDLQPNGQADLGGSYTSSPTGHNRVQDGQNPQGNLCLPKGQRGRHPDDCDPFVSRHPG